VVTTRAEYLRWRFKSGDIPIPLVTTSTNGGNRRARRIGTQIVLGQGTYNYDTHGGIGGPGSLGGRLTLGRRPRLLFPSRSTASGSMTSRPCFMARPMEPTCWAVGVGGQPGSGDIYVAGFPGLATGAIDINAQISMWGAGTDLVWNIAQTDAWMLDLRFGYRYIYLGETLNLSNSLQSTSPDIAVPFGGVNQFSTGFTTRVNDRFYARNDFNGAQLGVRNILNWWRFNLFLDTKLAIGQTRMETEVTGISA